MIVRIIGGIAVFFIIALICWAAIRGHELLLSYAQSRYQEIFVRYGVSLEAEDGYVSVRFPAYVGTIVACSELVEPLWVPPENVKPLINSLTGFSLKYGLITVMAPYVLFLVTVNYFLHIPKLVRRTA